MYDMISAQTLQGAWWGAGGAILLVGGGLAIWWRQYWRDIGLWPGYGLSDLLGIISGTFGWAFLLCLWIVSAILYGG